MSFDYKEQLISNGSSSVLQQKRELMLSLFSQVLKAVDPYAAVSSRIKKNCLFLHNKTIDVTKFHNVYVVGFGKGSIGMTQAVCDHLSITEGIAITNQTDKVVRHKKVETVVGGHPLPNDSSIMGAKKVLNLLSRCEPNDLVIILISGGGSALLASPRISLDDLQKTTKALLASGATIQEINTIRKHLSTVKGGQLVKSLPCKVVTFIVSDVVGDPLEFIASGPTVGDSTTFSDAFDILKKYKLWNVIPDSVRRVIDQGKKELIPETPSSDDPVFSHVSNLIVSNNSLACETAFTSAKKAGFHPVILSTRLTGEASELGPWLFERSKKTHHETGETVFISGGEPTVTLTGDGKGGRNQELVLSMVPLLKGSESVFASFGTDGVDGMSPAAGAIADGNTLHRAKEQGLDVELFLKNNDSFTFFHRLNDDIVIGPTGTNVMDVQILVL